MRTSRVIQKRHWNQKREHEETMTAGIINLNREKIERDLKRSIKGEIKIVWESGYHATIKKLFVRPHGKPDFEPWVCYGDLDGPDHWGPWDLYNVGKDCESWR